MTFSSHAFSELARLVKEARGITLDPGNEKTNTTSNLLDQLLAVRDCLSTQNHEREADTFQDVYNHCISPPDFGGLGLEAQQQLSENQEAEVIFLISAYLEGLNSADRQGAPLTPLSQRPPGRRGMTLSEKIFAAHDTERKGEVKPGDVIRVDVDWVIASELSWGGMEKAYNELGQPGIFRNDRVWLAGDHIVDPRNKEQPKIKSLIESSERARQVFKLSEYQGMNYTIMHTEFCRERAQPGMLVIGADSHTCSAGSVSCLSIGLGVADVTMPLITGETWFKVPETVEIRFVDRPAPGLTGKDVILYVLQQLKRNTVAADRVVEYTGPGLKHLSCDARFAIANMTTEFGGVTGVFVPDEITKSFVDRRKNPKYKKFATYYKPDDDAQYAETHIIDLSQVESFVARYPSPDDVVPVSEVAETKLDGCFIGACTTAREDLILGALVLEAGLKKGFKPVDHGTRKIVPGSRPILHNLRELGLLDVYEEAGFEVGVPGCSYCVGMSVDKAGKDEVWLSSQNRNFENRMGPGAIGSISSAVTVAASSFEMSITDPKPLLDMIDMARLEKLLGTTASAGPGQQQEVTYVEPGHSNDTSRQSTTGPPTADPAMNRTLPSTTTHISALAPEEDLILPQAQPQPQPQPTNISPPSKTLTGLIQTLGDFIDTDALAPSAAITTDITATELGTWCLRFTHPQFRRQVQEGMTVVVAGHAFGVGSSRENAVTALQGAGVKCVIAKSFAFIYGRNQPNLGLLGFVISDPEFYRVARDGVPIVVDVDGRTVEVADQKFGFELSQIEAKLVQLGGMSPAFRRWGKGLLRVMTTDDKEKKKRKGAERMEEDQDDQKMSW